MGILQVVMGGKAFPGRGNHLDKAKRWNVWAVWVVCKVPASQKM